MFDPNKPGYFVVVYRSAITDDLCEMFYAGASAVYLHDVFSWSEELYLVEITEQQFFHQ